MRRLVFVEGPFCWIWSAGREGGKCWGMLKLRCGGRTRRRLGQRGGGGSEVDFSGRGGPDYSTFLSGCEMITIPVMSNAILSCPILPSYPGIYQAKSYLIQRNRTRRLVPQPTHNQSLILTLLLNPIPLPPRPHPPINLLPRHPIPDQTKCHPQLRLHVAIPRLVVEKQHLLIPHPAGLVDPREMLRLVRGEDLDVVEVVERADGLGLRGGVVGEGGDDVQGFEHVAGEVGGVGA